MENIVLIGTSHSDPDGAENLEKVLKSESPQIVVVEGTEEKLNGSRKVRQAFCQGLRDKGYSPAEADQWHDAIYQLYEIEVGLKFCSDSGAQFYHMNDQSKITTERRLESVPINLNFVENTSLTPVEFMDKKRELRKVDMEIASYYIDKPFEGDLINDWTKDYYRDIGTIREKQMKDRLLQLIEENSGKKVVAIVGSDHLFRDPEGLSFYSILEEPRPRRIFI